MASETRKRMIGYVRVSTSEQSRGGVSLEAQAAKIRAYADLYGYDLVGIVEDAGFSGKTLDRPGMGSVIRMLDDEEVDGLIIAKLDRLTRSVRDMDHLVSDVFCEKKGRTLCSVADSLDTSNAGGRLIIGILTQVAQWERETIVERTTDALAQKKARGERVGNIPYGKRLAEDDKTLVEHLGERLRIRQMVSMRKGGMSLKQIADELNRIGIPTKNSGKTLKDGTVIQGKWTANRVMDVLKANDDVCEEGTN